MTQPKASPETMARLCEAVDAFEKSETLAAPNTPVRRALEAYRAETTPPLRSRAEVDADIVDCIRADWFANSGGRPVGLADHTRGNLLGLCREPTAPEPAPSAEPYRVHDLRNTLTNHDQDTREERPCGCEEAEALKDQVTELRRLLGHVYGTVAGLAKLLETLP